MDEHELGTVESKGIPFNLIERGSLKLDTPSGRGAAQKTFCDTNFA
jgi:hypothetical protein